jgi:hypothetical protein
MDTIKPLFTATATATGGRNGHTQARDAFRSKANHRRCLATHRQPGRNHRPHRMQQLLR